MFKEKCCKCQCINELEDINAYICHSCGTLNLPKHMSSKIMKNKKQFYFKNINYGIDVSK